MTTTKSPRKVMRAAYHLASQSLPQYSCKFSRQDFTLPQLFACLAVKELLKCSYRGIEEVLADSESWLADIGLDHAPDHNTLCRAADLLLLDAWRRVPNRRFKVVADAGYDSEANHRLARRDMGLGSVIPPELGRPPKDGGPPGGRWRRRMKRLLATAESRKRVGYTQRWQSETVHSMMKRNLGSELRGKTAWSRKRDMALKALTHDVMVFRRGSRQSRTGALSSVSCRGGTKPLLRAGNGGVWVAHGGASVIGIGHGTGRREPEARAG